MRQEMFYGGGAHGYTDYPTLEQSRAATEAGEVAPT
jgi:N-ethylmaleimide reductase